MRSPLHHSHILSVLERQLAREHATRYESFPAAQSASSSASHSTSSLTTRTRPIPCLRFIRHIRIKKRSASLAQRAEEETRGNDRLWDASPTNTVARSFSRTKTRTTRIQKPLSKIWRT